MAIDPSLIEFVATGFAILHLAATSPDRVAGWDAVLVSAASPQQAALYREQLQLARRMGHLPAAVPALVVPDRDGRRIGSGGATLGALRALAEAHPGVDWSTRRVLLVHAGGDSRRMPWANILGKLFIPFPLFASADRPHTLCDVLLALAAHLPQRMPAGGLVVLTGDVLPLFDPTRLAPPADGALVVTMPAPLDVAGRHGVIVGDGAGAVIDILQKPAPDEIRAAGALVGAAALLDTGIYGFYGRAFAALQGLACANPDPLAALLADGRECSLYEEVAAAFLPGKHAWLADRPLGRQLAAAVGSDVPFREHRADEMRFVHLGTSAEVLHHLGQGWNGMLAHRVLAENGPSVDPSAVVVASQLAPEVRVGRGSLVANSRLGSGCSIGSRCVVQGLIDEEDPLIVPDHVCIWQIAVRGGKVATACCGVDDNPKEQFARATFLNRDLGGWMAAHGVVDRDLWKTGEERTVWQARLFPVVSRAAGTGLCSFLLERAPATPAQTERWRAAERRSLAELHREMDPDALAADQREVLTRLCLRAATRAVEGAADHNLAELTRLLPDAESRTRFGALEGRLDPRRHPVSRAWQIRSDLSAACDDRPASNDQAAAAFTAVQVEVADALQRATLPIVSGLIPGASAQAELPVRFDLAGGWTDTPPYCLEHPARVVNLAAELDGRLPIGASVSALGEPVWDLRLRGGPSRRLHAPPAGPVDLSDPFALLVVCLQVCGFSDGTRITQGVRLETWSLVPKGSGLGGSSILAAAVVRALRQLAGDPPSLGELSDLVLVAEQRLTTGGGWQDQIGGIFPGVKCIESAPLSPLRLRVDVLHLDAATRKSLEERLVLVFTGQDRLAKNVLQLVVKRYLQRDARTLRALGRLAGLADEVRGSLSLGRLDEVGAAMDEAWWLHQELDPHCSNPSLDAMFRSVSDLIVGGKLAGAGGGGFLGLLARDGDCARAAGARLVERFPGAQVYPWRLHGG